MDIALGAGIFTSLVLKGVKKLSLLSQNTHLGWILSGSYLGTSKPLMCFTAVEGDQDTSHDLLQEFRETEEPVKEASSLS